MENTKAETILKSLWDMYGASVGNKFRISTDLNNKMMIEEFFFIILGGFGISYELNKSGLMFLGQNGYLECSLFDSDEMVITTAKRLREEFNTKQFEPMTKTGNFRKYRFIESKPITIAKAGNWLWRECKWDLENHLTSIDGMTTRKWLCTCPGIGMKSASWFLRNVGINDDYAVFDIHVLRFIAKLGIQVPEMLTEKTYIHLETILRDICNKIGVTLGKMDYLLWLLGRNGYLEYVG